MGEIMVRVAYAVMIIGVIFCFLFSRNHQQDIRKAVNEFALTFVKLSNYLSPKPPKEGLQVEQLPGGTIRPLPLAQQSDGIRAIIKRTNSSRTAQLFSQLDDAAEKVAKGAGINRTHKVQFQEPIDQLLMLTHTFLVGCENLESIDTPEKKAAFDSYLMEQPRHRMVLLKRITGSLADEYRELNAVYAAEMERMEAEELERRKKGKGRSAGEEPASEEPSGQPAAETSAVEIPSAAVEASAGEEAPAAADSSEQPGEETDLREKWGGWGCG